MARNSVKMSNYMIFIYLFEVDNFGAANNVIEPNIAVTNAINPKNSKSANHKPGPCCARSTKERMNAPPETRAIKSKKPPQSTGRSI
jgi:hypothetical protein